MLAEGDDPSIKVRIYSCIATEKGYDEEVMNRIALITIET